MDEYEALKLKNQLCFPLYAASREVVSTVTVPIWLKEEKRPFWNFFNIPSYILMIFMMGLGIGLRHFAKLPTIFFSVFYTGLGSALTLAGILFTIRWILAVRRAKSEKTQEMELKGK